MTVKNYSFFASVGFSFLYREHGKTADNVYILRHSKKYVLHTTNFAPPRKVQINNFLCRETLINSRQLFSLRPNPVGENAKANKICKSRISI